MTILLMVSPVRTDRTLNDGTARFGIIRYRSAIIALGLQFFSELWNSFHVGHSCSLTNTLSCKDGHSFKNFS